MFLLACLSPGPVWVVITSTSAAMSRRAGVLTGLGVAGATLTWAIMAMLGLGLLDVACLAGGRRQARRRRLPGLDWGRMIVGACHLASAADSRPGARHRGWIVLRRGCSSSITNPKAAAFFGSIFVVMLSAYSALTVIHAPVARKFRALGGPLQ